VHRRLAGECNRRLTVVSPRLDRALETGKDRAPATLYRAGRDLS
jgi:hypothetical protein